MTMKKQGKNKMNDNPTVSQKNMNLQTSNKVISSGVTQPHNAKKEGLGPNTNRGK